MDTTTAARGRARTGSAPRLAPRAAVVAVVAALGVLLLVPGAALASSVSISPQSPSGVRAGDSVNFTANVALDPGDVVTGITWSLDGTDAPGTTTFATGPLSAGTHTVSVTVSYLLADLTTGTLTDGTTVTAAANRKPTVSITTAPPEGQLNVPGALVADASDPDGDALTYAWTDNKAATFGAPTAATTSWTPQERGTHTITVTVNDGHGGSASSFVNISVPDQQPTAQFNVAGSGLVRTLTSTSFDPDGDQLSYTWSVSPPGALIASQGAAQTNVTFPAPGTYIVVLKVKETNGTLGDTSDPQTVVIGDASPTVSLSISPNPVAPNQPVTITATASDPDPDGANLTYAWDVNGTAYTTPTIPQQIFTTPGAYKVKVTVRDPQGATASDADTIIVSEAAPPSPPATPPPSSQPPVVVTDPPVQTPTTSKTAPKLLDPFPIVRIRGRIFPKYTKFDVFSIRAPKGARVRVRCKGSGCPRKWSIASVKKGTHWVRFRALERPMRPGTVLEIFVEKPGMIGKYTRFIVRAGLAPSRRDRCVTGSRSRVVRCPAG